MKVKEGMEKNYEEITEDWKDDFMLGAALRYSVRWADMMETLAADGVDIAKAAGQTKSVADTEGLTGYLYGLSVMFLTNTWEHGEELRVWHNKEYGYEGEGVVNPCIITSDDEQQPSADEDCCEER